MTELKKVTFPKFPDEDCWTLGRDNAHDCDIGSYLWTLRENIGDIASCPSDDSQLISICSRMTHPHSYLDYVNHRRKSPKSQAAKEIIYAICEIERVIYRIDVQFKPYYEWMLHRYYPDFDWTGNLRVNIKKLEILSEKVPLGITTVDKMLEENRFLISEPQQNRIVNLLIGRDDDNRLIQLVMKHFAKDSSGYSEILVKKYIPGKH